MSWIPNAVKHNPSTSQNNKAGMVTYDAQLEEVKSHEETEPGNFQTDLKGTNVGVQGFTPKSFRGLLPGNFSPYFKR